MLMVKDLGIQPYEKVYQDMLDFCEHRQADTSDEIWILQHEPVYTLGRAGDPKHLLLNPLNIPVVNANRGGQITYHGPGQLIVYFLLDLNRRNWGVRKLVCHTEQLVLDLLKHYGVEGHLICKQPGVYVDNRKIASLGFRITRGFSMHGLSLNVDMDLTPFQTINPCGYEGLEMVQLKQLVPEITLAQVEQKLLNTLKRNYSAPVMM